MSSSLERALDLLKGVSGRPRSLGELATDLGVHKTTVLRLLKTLELHGYVTHDQSHRYQLGMRAFELASDALAQRDVVPTSRPHLESLNRATGQTVHLAVLDGSEAVYVDKLDGFGAIGMYSRVGLRAPLHCTAVGKVLLASSPSRNRTLDGYRLTRHTENTITSRDELEAELNTVATQGWAHDFEEHEVFMNCVGVPVHNGLGAVVAAVSVTAPTIARSREEVVGLLPQLTETARAISLEFGYRRAV